MGKINESQQSEIVQLYLTGDISQPELGEMYGVSGVAIHKILRKHGVPGRKSWAQTGERKCSQCGEVLPMSEFYRKQDYWCKKCTSEHKRENRDYNWYYMHTYNITEDDYNEMLDEQNGKCAICGSKTKARLHIDHDHETGEIRGLVCTNCNTGLGMFKDNIEFLSQAIHYLSKFQ